MINRIIEFSARNRGLIVVLTVTGVVQLWHVFVFAFLFGCAAAFDAPHASQTRTARLTLGKPS